MNKTKWASFILVLIVALGLRLYHLGSQSLWQDELVSWNFATNDDWKALFWDNHPPLYPFILKLWSHLISPTEFWIRLPSVIISVASVAVSFFAIPDNYRRSIFFMLLMALNPLSIRLAQEARMYSLLEFCVTLTLLPSTNRFITTAGILGGILSHYLYWLFLALRTKSKWIFAIGMLVAVFAIDWHHLTWTQVAFEKSAFESTLAGITAFLGGSYIGAIFYSIVLLWAVVQKRPIPSQVLWGLLILFSFQLATSRVLLIDRYLIFLSPLLLLWLSESIFSLRTKALSLLIFTYGIYSWSFQEWKAPYNQVGIYLQRQSEVDLLTTRSAAIKAPYFNRPNINFVKLEKPKDIAEYIATNPTKSIYVLENYWSGFIYLQSLKEELSQMQRHSQILKFQFNEKSDILLVLKIDSLAQTK